MHRHVPALYPFGTTPHSLGVIHLHTTAIVVHEAQVVLRISITLLCRLSVPRHSLGVILLHTTAIAVHEAQVELCTGITLLCRLSKPHRGIDIVPVLAV